MAWIHCPPVLVPWLRWPTRSTSHADWLSSSIPAVLGMGPRSIWRTMPTTLSTAFHNTNQTCQSKTTQRQEILKKKTKSRLHEQQAALLFIRMLLNWRTLNKRCTQKPNCHNCHNCPRYSYTPCESNACQLVLLEFASVEASWPSAGTAAVVAVDFAASAVVAAAAAVSLCLPASSEALVSTMEGSSLPHPQHCLHLEACL